MWIFTVAPDWVIHAVFTAGVVLLCAGFLLKLTPLKTYRLACNIVGALVAAFGLYLEGGLQNNQQWKFKVAELQVKLQQAETKAAEKNLEIQERVVTRNEVVRERGRDIIKYIDKIVDREILKEVTVPGPERDRIVEVIKYIENCPVPQILIDQHNKAASPPEEKKQ